MRIRRITPRATSRARALALWRHRRPYGFLIQSTSLRRRGAQGGDYRAVAAPDGEASLTGNQVSLETQAMKLSETRQEYALATSLYRKSLAMLRLAARGQ